MELGWTLVRRRAHLEEQSRREAAVHHRLEFQDRFQLLPVYSLPIGFPKYRLLNGRTASLQEEWLAEHLGKGEDFFRRDPELAEAQQVQHELLAKLIRGAGLLDYFRDPLNKQKDFVILDSNGFVINGNRRLCAWRILYDQEASKYPHFGHIDAAILPPSDEKAIDKLEGALQVEPNIQDDYTWDALANMMRVRKALHKLDDKSLASFYKMNERQVRDLQEMLDYASVYLKAKGKEKHWSLVSDKEYAFRKMIEKRRSLTDPGEKKLFEECAFSLIDDPTGRRLYESIPDLQRFLPKVREKLVERFPIRHLEDPGASKDDHLFGLVNERSQSDIKLAEQVAKQENTAEAALLIKDVIDSERQLEKDQDSANYVLKRLQRANSEIQSALSGIRAESKKTGIAEQIEAIQAVLKRISDWARP